MTVSRRDVLKMSAAGGVALALPIQRAFAESPVLANRIAESALPAPFTVPFTVPPTILPIRSDETTDYYRVSMQPAVAQILPGYQTPVWGYNGLVPGPTFDIAQGRNVVVRQVNNLPDLHPVLGYTPWTSVHLHGQASSPEYDGYTSDICNPGEYKDYRYPNFQYARTLWYHDHGVHHTAENVYMGLAGMYLLRDARDQALPLPKGEYDVPLMLCDRMFNADGSLLFTTDDGDGFYGDVLTVNGRPWPTMQVKRRKYRFRILNASVSRSYLLSLSNGASMTVVATDAGLMPAPVAVKEFRHGNGERYEVVIDFARYAPGTRIVLRNGPLRNNTAFADTDKVMAFDVVGGSYPTTDNSVPGQLYPAQPTMALQESQAVRTRRLDFGRNKGQWTINGGTWNDVVRSGFSRVVADPYRDEVELWEVRNLSGGWNHPVHLHFVDFRILSRNGKPAMAHERGAKDTVYVGENETVRLLIKFDQGQGTYMLHCHNLVHEDHDMMAQFTIRNDAVEAHDPFADPGKPLPEGDL